MQSPFEVVEGHQMLQYRVSDQTDRDWVFNIFITRIIITSKRQKKKLHSSLQNSFLKIVKIKTL